MAVGSACKTRAVALSTNQVVSESKIPAVSEYTTLTARERTILVIPARCCTHKLRAVMVVCSVPIRDLVEAGAALARVVAVTAHSKTTRPAAVRKRTLVAPTAEGTDL